MRIDDLSPLQLQVFEAFKPGESLTRMELKERLNITVRSTLARIISRLEVFGLLEKTEDVPSRIQLTKQGELLHRLKQKEEETLDVNGYITTEEMHQIDESYSDSYKSNTDDSDMFEIDCSDCNDSVNVDVTFNVVRQDIEWLRQLSLDVAGRVKNETDLNRISVWSRTASDLANTYSMLSFNEFKELMSE